jgi:hypothetical protein
MHQVTPETPILPRDIYNYNSQFRRIIRQGRSSTEALIQYLQDSSIKHSVLKDPASRRLQGIFIMCPESVSYLQHHYDVLIIDNTYRTNRFNLPLMDIIGRLV